MSEEERAKIQEILHGTQVGQKSLWATTLETMSMADGKTHKKDVTTKTLEEGLHILQGLVRSKQQETTPDARWTFDLTPTKDFDASIDDLLKAFVQWSYKDDLETFNISKAFRRLESYVSWMEENRNVLSQELSDETKRTVHQLWSMKLTHCGKSSNQEQPQLVWWIDLAEVSPQTKDSNHNHTLQYFVWACHFVLFQHAPSIILMENLKGLGMMQMFSMVPAKLSAKLDRLTIGVLPLKMKSIILLYNPRWMSFLLALMRPFLSKKMRTRMKVIHSDVEQSVIDIVGIDNVPKGFCGMEGRVETDEFAKILK